MKRNVLFSPAVAAGVLAGGFLAAGCREGTAPANVVQRIVKPEVHPADRLEALQLALASKSFQSEYQPEEYAGIQKLVSQRYSSDMDPKDVRGFIDAVGKGRRSPEEVLASLSAASPADVEKFFIGPYRDAGVFPRGVTAEVAAGDRKIVVETTRKVLAFAAAPTALRTLPYADLASLTSRIEKEAFPELVKWWRSGGATDSTRATIARVFGLYRTTSPDALALLREAVAGHRNRVEQIQINFGRETGMAEHLGRTRREAENLFDQSLRALRASGDKSPETFAALKTAGDDVLELRLLFRFPYDVQRQKVEALPPNPKLADLLPAYDYTKIKERRPDFVAPPPLCSVRFSEFEYVEYVDRSTFYGGSFPATLRALFQGEGKLSVFNDEVLGDRQANRTYYRRPTGFKPTADEQVATGSVPVSPQNVVGLFVVKDSPDLARTLNRQLKEWQSLLSDSMAAYDTALKELGDQAAAPGLSEGQKGLYAGVKGTDSGGEPFEHPGRIEEVKRSRAEAKELLDHVEALTAAPPRYMLRAAYDELDEATRRDVIAYDLGYSLETLAQAAVALKELKELDPNDPAEAAAAERYKLVDYVEPASKNP
ncbi:MAG: hypothetical protein HY719_15440 [Planctomycetes bacterium]|nr:hypothetical protein [Planctomycetota bacterium]